MNVQLVLLGLLIKQPLSFFPGKKTDKVRRIWSWGIHEEETRETVWREEEVQRKVSLYKIISIIEKNTSNDIKTNPRKLV